MNATVSNDRVGIAVILDAANGAGYVDPEVKASYIIIKKFFLLCAISTPLSLVNENSYLMILYLSFIR